MTSCRMTSLILIFLGTLTLDGCGAGKIFDGTTLISIRDRPQYSTPLKTYNAPLEFVYESVKTSMKEAGLVIEDDTRLSESKLRIIGHHEYQVTSGQFVRVILEQDPADAGKTHLFYDSGKEYYMNVMSDLWSMQKKILMYVDDSVTLYEKRQRRSRQ